MAKKKEEEKKDVAICSICKGENALKARICEHCGAFMPRRAEVNAVMAALNKKYRKEEGDNLICRMGEHPLYASNMPVISTGSLKLDKALLGGFPMSSRIMISGDENSGKTTLALHCVAEVQRRGGTVVYIDIEQALDAEYATRIGVDINELIIAKPESGTEALDYLIAMAPVADLIVLDSVAACASINTINKEAEVDTDGDVKQAYSMGDLARLMSDFQPKLMNVVAKTTCTYIFINQLRTQINKKNPAYSPQKPMGGRAPKYFSNIQLQIRTEKELLDDDVYYGRESVVKIVRAKHLGRWQTTQIRIGNSGIDRLSEVLDLAIDYSIIQKKGAYYYFNSDTYFAQGEDNARATLIDDPDFYHLIENAVLAKIDEAHEEAKAYGRNIEKILEAEDE